MQLEKILQSQGFGSRRDCRSLILGERVAVGAAVCDDPAAEFDAHGLPFSVDGEAWVAQLPGYLMLHKPAGFECSRKPLHHPSVFSLLPPPLRRRELQPVGRLDEDTTGLLLFSDDGGFIHAMSSPKRKLPKIYEVVSRHPLDGAICERLLAGVVLHDDPAPVLADAAEILGPTLLRLTISAGRYHQVKRMVAAAGNRVESLRRVAIGGLALPADLPSGAWRWLADEDLQLLGYTR